LIGRGNVEPDIGRVAETGHGGVTTGSLRVHCGFTAGLIREITAVPKKWHLTRDTNGAKPDIPIKINHQRV
jgi:hypothetical protein